jgi:hypothetical protein
MYRLADRLWLGIDRSQMVAKRQIAAALLFYADGRSWDEILELIGRGRVSRRTLDEWLAMESVLLGACYSHIYLSNDDLSQTIIARGDANKPIDLDELAVQAFDPQDKTPPEGWTWKEVQIVLWRFRIGLVFERIQRKSHPMAAEDIERVFDRAREFHPFADRATQLRSVFERAPLGSNPLQQAGLWKRLVFQYFASDTLPYLQILERTKPAADVGGFNINHGMINIWVSRSGDRLAEYAKGVPI